MELLDSRRLTGINVVSDELGAVIDVALTEADAENAIETWRAHARAVLDAVGWQGEKTFVRRFSGGAGLQITAPIDGWYAACEVNEWAWAATRADLGGDATSPLDEAAIELRRLIESESNPRLMALRGAAEANDCTLLSDDEIVSVGLGRGSRSWAVDELPSPDDVDWDAVHDIPVVLITGTNGKTTTARLLARMVAASGAVPGNTSSDGVQIDGEIVIPGDYTGGEGARTLLRDRRVEYAVLETARGGMLRRGLPVPRAQAALVSNVGLDHLGEFGVADMDELADTKMLVARAVGPDGALVLNADDEALVARAGGRETPITWVAYSRLSPVVQDHVKGGGEALYVRDRALVRMAGGRFEELAGIDDVPLTMGGAARYNVYNALGAAALGLALDLGREAVVRGLCEMRSTTALNPGRGNLFAIGGARAIVDFAHNPPGVEAATEMAIRMPAGRRLVVLGQAGDRDDDAIRGLARAAWKPGIDRVIVKELPRYLRGRKPGEVPRIIAAELVRVGAPEDAVEIADSELEAVRRAVAWSGPDDLLLLLLQERSEAVAYLREVGSEGWDE